MLTKLLSYHVSLSHVLVKGGTRFAALGGRLEISAWGPRPARCNVPQARFGGALGPRLA